MTNLLFSATKADGEKVGITWELPDDFRSWSLTDQFIHGWRELVGAFHPHGIDPWRILIEDVTDKTWDDETGEFK